MCRVDYADGAHVSTQNVCTARKEHPCVECRRTIRPGERYERAKWLDDFGWCSVATCVQCMAAREWLVAECGGWIYTEVLDELVEHWEESAEYQTWQLGRLIACMKTRWRDGTRPIPEIAA